MICPVDDEGPAIGKRPWRVPPRQPYSSLRRDARVRPCDLMRSSLSCFVFWCTLEAPEAHTKTRLPRGECSRKREPRARGRTEESVASPISAHALWRAVRSRALRFRARWRPRNCARSHISREASAHENRAPRKRNKRSSPKALRTFSRGLNSHART